MFLHSPAFLPSKMDCNLGMSEEVNFFLPNWFPSAFFHSNREGKPENRFSESNLFVAWVSSTASMEKSSIHPQTHQKHGCFLRRTSQNSTSQPGTLISMITIPVTSGVPPYESLTRSPPQVGRKTEKRDRKLPFLSLSAMASGWISNSHLCWPLQFSFLDR